MNAASAPRARGGCLTILLVLIIVINPLVAIYYITSGSSVQDTYPDMPDWALPVLIVFSLANCVFGIALWLWKKWGLYGFAVSSVVAFIVNIMSGIPVFSAIFGFVGLGLLAFLLRNEWPNMD
jgi:hypothetical protein